MNFFNYIRELALAYGCAYQWSYEGENFVLKRIHACFPKYIKWRNVEINKVYWSEETNNYRKQAYINI